MFRISFIAIAVAAGIALSGVAQAQVAAPVLTPGSANIIATQSGFAAEPTYLPLNPAVMTWSGNSVFGLGQANIDRKIKSPIEETYEFSGTYGGLRWNGEKFAIGLETISITSESSDVDFTFDATEGGIAGMFADWVSLGAGLGSVEVDSGTSKDSLSGWTAGGSLKFGNVFYLGLGMGRESVKHEQTGNDYDDERPVSMYGFALYTGGGKGATSGSAVWHLEYNVLDKEDFTDSLGDSVSGYTRTTGTVEVIWSSLLLSYSSYGIQAKTGDGEVEGSAIEAGWVSDKSFFVTARLHTYTEKDTNTEVDNNSMSINVGLQF